MEQNEIRSAIEAILVASSEPVSPNELSSALEIPQNDVDEQLGEIERSLDQSVGGFMLERVGGGFRLATRPEYDEQLRRFFSRKRENRMTIASLETLAIVAYRQPITGPEVSELRGVNSSGVLRTLLERRMIRIAGRKNVVGSPFLYKTTKDFLLHFGLERIQDLPKLEEFGEILGEQVADDLGIGDMAEAEVAAADEMDEAAAEAAAERDETERMASEDSDERDERAEQYGAEDAEAESDAVESSGDVETSDDIETSGDIETVEDIQTTDDVEAADDVDHADDDSPGSVTADEER